MKLRLIVFILLTLSLSACSFSLAEDITPPPDYKSPAPPPTATPAPATATAAPGAALEGTPVTDASLLTTAAGMGMVTGSVVNGSGGALPADLTVALRGFDHALDASGPQEVVNVSASVQPDGSFLFEDIELLEGRIFLAQVDYNDISFGSSPATVEGGITQLALSPVKIYDTTTDVTALQLEQAHIYFDFSTAGVLQMYEVYVITNSSDKAIVVAGGAKGLPFIELPAGAENIGFQLTDDSAPLFAASAGFAILPSDQYYGFVAFFTLPYEKKLELTQPFVLSTPSVTFFVPEGVKVKSDQLTDNGVQDFQGTNYHVYVASNLEAGSMLTLTISGKPHAAAPGVVGADSRQNLLIGVGAFGVVLILAGIWLYWRDRTRPADDEEAEGESEFEDAGGALDAIIALDDLHHAGKLPDDVYQQRRAELKERLKEIAQ